LRFQRLAAHLGATQVGATDSAAAEADERNVITHWVLTTAGGELAGTGLEVAIASDTSQIPMFPCADADNTTCPPRGHPPPAFEGGRWSAPQAGSKLPLWVVTNERSFV